jgi:hypothetical protein
MLKQAKLIDDNYDCFLGVVVSHGKDKDMTIASDSEEIRVREHIMILHLSSVSRR